MRKNENLVFCCCQVGRMATSNSNTIDTTMISILGLGTVKTNNFAFRISRCFILLKYYIPIKALDVILFKFSYELLDNWKNCCDYIDTAYSFNTQQYKYNITLCRYGSNRTH